MDAPTETVELTPGEEAVRTEIRELCEPFDAAYWREKDRTAEYPHEFADALAEAGWFGALVPEAYGGRGLGTPEVAVLLREIAANGGGFSAAQAVHGTLYNTPPIVAYGSEELKADLLPKLADGERTVQSLALTEPGAGSDSLAIETTARRDGGEYVVDGHKLWISRVDVTDYLLLIARTTPVDDVETRTRGISMFLVDVDDARQRGALETRQIRKTASECVHSYELWFDDLRIPATRLVGEEGAGFYQLLDGLNEERLFIAAECVGLGEVALAAGVRYADQREVFDRQIGANQAIQHPLADAHARLTAARHLVHDAARTAEGRSRDELGVLANMSKYLGAEAAFRAADAAVQTHGGRGVAREYDVERYLREARLARLVPITQELALNYLGETALGLPRSY